jgi:NADPH2:quinone reductase
MRMKAAVVASPGNIDIRDVPMPEPAADEILVKVKAAGLNRADLLVALGHFHGGRGGPGAVPGIEAAGEVVRSGSAMSPFKQGDKVLCSVASAFAEYVVANVSRSAVMPKGVDWVQAGTLPVALQTMHNAIVTAGALHRGESVLIQGASSGVGLMGLQIAKYMGAGFVIGTSTNAERRAKLADYGADLAIDTTDSKWADKVKEATGGKGVNLIIDMVSGGVIDGNMQAAALLGRIVNVGRLGGMKGEFNYDLHALKRLSYIGVTFRTRTLDEVAEIIRRMRGDLWPAVERGELRLPISRTYPLDKAGEALAHMKANAHFGKIALVM